MKKEKAEGYPEVSNNDNLRIMHMDQPCGEKH